MKIQSNPPLTLGAWFRHDPIWRHINRTDPASVLEFGVGQGHMGARIAEGRTYVGVELDETSLKVAKSVLPSSATALNKFDPAEHPAFDLVCAFEVLEHIENDSEVLAEWVSLIKPGGHILLSVPAMQSRMSAWDELAGHFRRYDPLPAEELFKDAGLVDIRIALTGYPLGFLLENMRNRVAAKKGSSEGTMEERTSQSARLLQPLSGSKYVGHLLRAASFPFRHLQRIRTGRGTGMVISGQVPQKPIDPSLP